MHHAPSNLLWGENHLTESITCRKPQKSRWSWLCFHSPLLPALTAPSGWEMQSKRALGGVSLVFAPQNPGVGAGKACISLANSQLLLALQLQPQPRSLLGNGIFILKILLEFLVNEKFPSPPSLGTGGAGQPPFPHVVWGGLLSPLQCSAIKDTEMANTTSFFLAVYH